MRKRWVCGLLWALASLTVAVGQTSDWKEYVYRNDGIAFSVPSEPTQATETIQSGLGPAQMHNYTSETPIHLVYLTSVVTYAKDLDGETAVQQAKKGVADSLKAEVLSERKISLQGRTGIEFELKSAEYHAHMRYFAVGNKLIGLLALAPLDVGISPGGDTFLQSLRLLDDSGMAQPAQPARTSSTGRGWQEYSYKADGVAFSAPSAPALQKDTTQTDLGPQEIHNYSVEQGDGSVLMVSVADFKRPDLDAKDAVRRAKEGSIKAVKGTLVSERDITFGSYSGRQFEVETATFHSRTRYFFINGKLIGLISIVPKEKPFSSDTDRFFESFRLLSNGQ